MPIELNQKGLETIDKMIFESIKNEYKMNLKEINKATFESALIRQYGGNHYKQSQLQPVEIAYRNNLCFRIFSSLKYLFRHNKDGGEGALDIKKAIHYLQFLLEQEYDVLSKIEYSDECKVTNEHEVEDEPDELK